MSTPGRARSDSRVGRIVCREWWALSWLRASCTPFRGRSTGSFVRLGRRRVRAGITADRDVPSVTSPYACSTSPTKLRLSVERVRVLAMTAHKARGVGFSAVTILIVGGSGLLGRELIRQSLTAGRQVAATYLTQPGGTGVPWHPLDLRHRADVVELLRTVRPGAVINAAFQQYDWASTADGAAHLALAAAAEARFVHVSSDAVFSGAAIHYDETAVPDPVTPYGAAKAAAETAIKAIVPAAVVARTSLMRIGGGASQHERRAHALASGEITGALFTDDIRCPVHVTDLAAALLELAESDDAGIHHIAGADAISRYELGTLIAARDGLDVTALPSGQRADGPVDIRLDCTRTQQKLRTRLRGAREFLAG